MKGTIDQYLVETDCLYEKGMIIEGSIGDDQFFEKTLNGDDDNLLYSPNMFKRTYGTVVGSPSRMSDAPIDDRDGITETIGEIFGDIAQVGVTAHFFWTSTAEHNIVSKERLYGSADGIQVRYVFRIAANRVVCFSNDAGEIKMNGDFVLLRAIREDESNIRTLSGIYISDKPEMVMLKGVVAMSNKGMVGMTVAFQPNADTEMVILGEKYYVMRHKYIIAICTDDGMAPVDTNMFVAPDEQVKFYPNGFEIPEMYREPVTTGMVTKIGSNCGHISVGDRIKWAGSPIVVDSENILRESMAMVKFISE